jgi:hypothetical protein
VTIADVQRVAGRPVTGGARVIRILVWIAAGALVTWFTATVLPVGYNPTDDGFVLAQAHRILGGEVPHTDFVSPRPAGSAIIHAVTFLLPGPTLILSRAFVLLEVVVTAWCWLIVVPRVLTPRNALQHLLGAVTLAAIAFHTFPIMAWHTIDGLLLLSLGAVGLRKGLAAPPMSRGALVGAGIALSAAALVKQSFAPAYAIGAIVVVVITRRDTVVLVRSLCRYAGGVLVPFAYVAWVSAAGGASDLWSQVVTGPASVSALEPLLRPLRREGPAQVQGRAIAWMAVATVVVAVVGIVIGRARHRTDDGPGAVRSVIAAVGSMVGMAGVIVVLQGRLGLGGTWGAVLWWCAAASVATAWACTRRPDPIGVAALAVGVMTSLSWGYDNPNLVAGLLVLLVVDRSVVAGATLLPHRTAAHVAAPRLVVERLVGAAVAMVTLVSLLASVHLRDRSVYRDVPAADQEVNLGAVGAGLRGVRTNVVTATFVDQVAACLRDHPASRLAVVPDAPGLPALLDRTDPLPVDWWYPLELPIDMSGVWSSVARVDSDGDYLVMFQTVRADGLPLLSGLPEATATSALADYPGGSITRLRAELTGEQFLCGSFVAVYHP